MKEIQVYANFIWFLKKFGLCSIEGYKAAHAEFNRKRNSILFLERLNGGA